LYIEADDAVIARRLVEQNTPYNIEFVQELDEKHLAYEKENADFKLAEF
jgi:DNA-dependent RNA polymerase auxiliary subunit epsilon